MTTQIPSTAAEAPEGVVFRPVTVPATVTGADAEDFIAMTLVRNRVYAENSGHDDHAMTPAELLPHFSAEQYELHMAWLVLRNGEPAGRIVVDLPLEGGSKVAYWQIEVLRAHWDRGIGTAAYAIVERVAREHDRSILQSWAEHPSDPNGTDRVSAPTGFGSVPKDHSARFYLRQGHRLEQVVRVSAFDLTAPFDTVERLRGESEAAAAGYRVVQWTAPTPAEFADGYAWMKSRMTTDAPSAGLTFDEEVWDAARVAKHDAKYLDAGRTLQVTAAQHIATGELCAFNELVIGEDPTAASHQDDTLVLAAHRGHRLGMLVKTVGLLSWRAVAPQSPRMITYNAEENRPMLDINETIGFAPIAYEGAWKGELR